MTGVVLAESTEGAPSCESVDGSTALLPPWHDRARRCGVHGDGRVVGPERPEGAERGQLAGPPQALLAARRDDAEAPPGGASTGSDASDDVRESWQLRRPHER